MSLDEEIIDSFSVTNSSASFSFPTISAHASIWSCQEKVWSIWTTGAIAVSWSYILSKLVCPLNVTITSGLDSKTASIFTSLALPKSIISAFSLYPCSVSHSSKAFIAFPVVEPADAVGGVPNAKKCSRYIVWRSAILLGSSLRITCFPAESVIVLGHLDSSVLLTFFPVLSSFVSEGLPEQPVNKPVTIIIETNSPIIFFIILTS